VLYDVPQTNDPTETAMVSMIARLRTTLPKPEALASISDATMAQHLADAISVVASALGDRVPVGSVIVKWDSALDGAARTVAGVSVYDWRGRNREAGADDGLSTAQKRADAYLARLRSPDREEQPIFVLSPGGVPADAPQVATSHSAQAWTRPVGHRFGPNGIFGRGGPC